MTHLKNFRMKNLFRQFFCGCTLLLLPASNFACECFDLQHNSQYYKLSNELYLCVLCLPEIERLHGIIVAKNYIFGDNIDKITRYYINEYFPYYSTKTIGTLCANLRQDFEQEMDSLTLHYLEDIEDFASGNKHCYWVDENDIRQCIPYCRRKLSEIPTVKLDGHKQISEFENKQYEILERIITLCKKQYHKNPRTFYESGRLHFLRGDVLEAINDGIALLKQFGEKTELSNIYLQLGEAYSETLEYDKAIESLTKAIASDPENKLAYFERAVAYFEDGQFDRAFEDYLVSGMKPQSFAEESLEFLAFAAGISFGSTSGQIQAGLEFIPSLLSSFRGMYETLWTLAKDPVQVSKDFASAAYDCMNFIIESSAREKVEAMVPEFRSLIDSWDQLPQFERGEKIGYIAGKYGLEIFASAGIIKGMQAYRQLKRANNLLNLETATLSQRNKSALIAESAKRAKSRQEAFSSANLKIQWGKQGKHVEGHNSYNPMANRSVLVHPDPQTLVDKFAGKGVKIGNSKPGVAGYKEKVDFGEFIGYVVDDKTGKKTPTTWGKIHYAKDGAHIVPAKPRT